MRQLTEKQRAYLEFHYGMPGYVYESLLLSQGRVCAICKGEFGDITPFVDHDHASGKVRGLLCRNCNTGLGMFSDSIEKLQNAQDYLKRDPWENQLRAVRFAEKFVPSLSKL